MWNLHVTDYEFIFPYTEMLVGNQPYTSYVPQHHSTKQLKSQSQQVAAAHHQTSSSDNFQTSELSDILNDGTIVQAPPRVYQ